MEEVMIQAQATAARIACARMTMPHLSALRASVERASCLAARSEWDRKAAAHAEIFALLADMADDPVLAPLLEGGAAYARELMLVVGRAADGMIVSSRRRLLEHLRAGDEDRAALEMERHLRSLHYMWRLARCRPETGGHDRRAISSLTTDAALGKSWLLPVPPDRRVHLARSQPCFVEPPMRLAQPPSVWWICLVRSEICMFALRNASVRGRMRWSSDEVLMVIWPLSSVKSRQWPPRVL